MSDYTFYNLKGEPFEDIKYFIELYSNTYYYVNDKGTEDRIDSIYKRDTVITADGLVDFLRWKVGDKHNAGDIITQYGQHIDTDAIRALAERIEPDWADWEPRDIYSAIVNKDKPDELVKNLGAVYSLALVSIISKGREPIYDKFAEIALDVILDKRAFREPMKYREMPDKMDVNAVMDRYKKYKDKLNKVFTGKYQGAWKGNRDIDRALWTYGHMFR